MLRAHSTGPKMVTYLEEIGIERQSDLRGHDAGIIAMRIDIALGCKHMNSMGLAPIGNVIALAEEEEGARGRFPQKGLPVLKCARTRPFNKLRGAVPCDVLPIGPG
ncbi:hypothetical protein [Nitratireductor luteus]|uniref:hypothetical protein n=1 Tax=Nitratireductor luteus TaxID=2976980 RepID=UPI00223EBC47|nr:hypothetical protein [Nitratireductor luteus]